MSEQPSHDAFERRIFPDGSIATRDDRVSGWYVAVDNCDRYDECQATMFVRNERRREEKWAKKSTP